MTRRIRVSSWPVCLTLVAILGGRSAHAPAQEKTKLSAASPYVNRVKSATLVQVAGPATDGSAARVLELKLPDHRGEKVQIQLRDRKLEARDDGREADQRSGDGVYSARLYGDSAQRFEKLAQRLKSADAKRVERRAFEKATGEPAAYCAAPPLPPTGLSASEQQRLIDQALMIIDTSVVDSTEAQSGSWSFGHLMTEMANQEATGIEPSVFTERWLSLWLKDQQVNEFSSGATAVPKRENMQALVLRPWREQSGGGRLDLPKAPLRLLAIVFRLDLRNNLVIGPAPSIGGGPAGELRFVFGVVDRQHQQQPFTIIFEYNVRREEFAGVLDWADQVYGLYRKFDKIDSDAYRNELKRLTTCITNRNANPEQVPNASSLAQIRTNENALNRVWELREFRLDGGNSGYLREVTVKQTPDLRFNRSARLGEFIRQHESDILCEMHAVPVEFEAEAFLASSALNPSEDETPTEATLFWNAPGLEPRLLDARHLFSLTTCNGCHGGETKTNTFLHIAPRDVGERSVLSGFLTGETVADAAGQMQGGIVKTREFNDLQRRA